MSIRKKLLSGYIIIALAVVCVGYLSARATQELNTTFDAITVQTIPVIDAVNDLRYFGARALSYASELALILSPSEKGIQQTDILGEQEKLEDAFANYRDAIDRYTSLVSHRKGEVQREVLDMIVSSSATLQHLLVELLNLERKGGSREALLSKMDEIEAYELTFLYAVDAALASEVEQFNTDREEVQQAIDLTRNIAVVFGPASIIAAVLITIYLSRVITSSLMALKNASLAVASGNWNVRVPRVSKGEFNDVIQTFNDMASALHSKAIDVSSSEAYCHEILDSMTEPLIVTDTDGRIRTVNAAILNLLGFSKEELIGKSVIQIFGKSHRENILQQWLPKLSNGGSIPYVRTDCLNKLDEEIPMIVSASSMRGRYGNVDGIVYVGKVIPETLSDQHVAFNA